MINQGALLLFVRQQRAKGNAMKTTEHFLWYAVAINALECRLTLSGLAASIVLAQCFIEGALPKNTNLSRDLLVIRLTLRLSTFSHFRERLLTEIGVVENFVDLSEAALKLYCIRSAAICHLAVFEIVPGMPSLELSTTNFNSAFDPSLPAIAKKHLFLRCLSGCSSSLAVGRWLLL